MLERVKDSKVSADAIRLEACAISFNRSKYSGPEDVLLTSEPKHNGVASLRVGDVPRELAAGSPVQDGELCVEDDPQADNEAHAEVRVNEAGCVFDKSWVIRAGLKSKIKKELARLLRVDKQPTPWSPTDSANQP